MVDRTDAFYLNCTTLANPPVTLHEWYKGDQDGTNMELIRDNSGAQHRIIYSDVSYFHQRCILSKQYTVGVETTENVLLQMLQSQYHTKSKKCLENKILQF